MNSSFGFRSGFHKEAAHFFAFILHLGGNIAIGEGHTLILFISDDGFHLDQVDHAL